MENRKLEIIQQLMDQLAEEMEYSSEDLDHRLGRKKPVADVTMMKVGAEGPALERAEEELGMDLDGDHEEGESPRHAAMVVGDDDEDMPMDEDDSLKQRLMRMRG